MLDLKLLYKMLETPSISGYELEFQKMLNKELVNIDDVTYNHHSLMVTHGINEKSKVKVMLLAHVDEIGLIIENVENNGICKLTNVGAIKPYMYIGQHVVVYHKDENGNIKKIPGVIGYNAKMTSGNMTVEDLNLDLGTLSKEETLKLVSIGDVLIHEYTYQMLENNLLSARALDDKIGVYICTEVLRRVKEMKIDKGVYFVATVGEETTGRGAKFATTYVTPTCAIALDVGSGTDVNYRDNFTHEVKLGNGPILTIASHANQILTRKIINSAKKLNINLQPAVEIARTYTDMDNIYLEEKGIPSQLISIPLRYMHSSVEVCSLKDVEEIIELLVDLIKNMDENGTFNPFEE